MGVGWGVIIKILIGRRGGLVFEKRGGNAERRLMKKTCNYFILHLLLVPDFVVVCVYIPCIVLVI